MGSTGNGVEDVTNRDRAVKEEVPKHKKKIKIKNN